MGASRKRFGAEEVVKLLRQIEVLQGNGKSLPEACKAVGIVEQTLRDELLNGELFYGLKELKVIVG